MVVHARLDNNDRTSTPNLLPFSCQMTPNWSDLSGDLVYEIARRLADPVDFLNFRAVCRQWRAAAPLSEHPPFLPWLCMVREHCYEAVVLQFYSLASDKIRTLRVPAFRGTYLAGYGDDGRLLGICRRRFSSVAVVNPVTGSTIHLPPLPSILTGGNLFRCRGFVADGMAVIYNNLTGSYFSFCRLGDEQSTWQAPTRHRHCLFFNMAYHKGMLLFRKRGLTAVVDAITGKDNADIPSPDNRWKNYFVASSGCLLWVSKVDGPENAISFRVYKLEDCGDGNQQWLETDSIGDDRVLFLSHRCSLSLKAGDCVGFRANCIYFFRPDPADDRYCCICEHSLTDCTTAVVRRLPGCGDAWFLPSLR